jgi:hypothetical protein
MWILPNQLFLTFRLLIERMIRRISKIEIMLIVDLVIDNSKPLADQVRCTFCTAGRYTTEQLSTSTIIQKQYINYNNPFHFKLNQQLLSVIKKLLNCSHCMFKKWIHQKWRRWTIRLLMTVLLLDPLNLNNTNHLIVVNEFDLHWPAKIQINHQHIIKEHDWRSSLVLFQLKQKYYL